MSSCPLDESLRSVADAIAACGLPESIRFQTEGELALDMAHTGQPMLRNVGAELLSPAAAW